METKTVSIQCDDGTKLAAELFIPQAPKAVVQFNPGTAAKRGVYRKFLTYLAEQGFLCCIMDYRGFGESRSASLKGSTITYSDMGVKDMPAVKQWLEKQYPELPLFVVAHSAGGQQVGFMHNWRGIKGLITFGVSAAHFSAMPLSYRLQSYFFFYALAPVSNALVGYVAAERLNAMDDLPKPFAKQWRDWCSVPDYFFDPKYFGVSVPRGGFKQFDFPIVNYHATDDEISTPVNIENFWKHISSSAGVHFKTLNPETVQLNNIGHFGYFRSALKDTLWQEVAAELEKIQNQ